MKEVNLDENQSQVIELLRFPLMVLLLGYFYSIQTYKK